MMESRMPSHFFSTLPSFIAFHEYWHQVSIHVTSRLYPPFTSLPPLHWFSVSTLYPRVPT